MVVYLNDWIVCAALNLSVRLNARTLFPPFLLSANRLDRLVSRARIAMTQHPIFAIWNDLSLNIMGFPPSSFGYTRTVSLQRIACAHYPGTWPEQSFWTEGFPMISGVFYELIGFNKKGFVIIVGLIRNSLINKILSCLCQKMHFMNTKIRLWETDSNLSMYGIYIAPLQGNNSEALPAQARAKGRS